MPFNRTPEFVGFQRWVVGAYDKQIPWNDFKKARWEPTNLGGTVQPTLGLGVAV